MDFVKNKYNDLSNIPSDINEHLPTLYNYATKCESVLELGVRGCISSWAFTYGLLNNNKSVKEIFLNDIEKCDISELLDTTKELDIKINYEWINDLELELNKNYDLTFIDTWHVYGQLKRELEKYSKITNKYIIMHDTTVDEIYGETIRMFMNSLEQSQKTGIPVGEINCGLWPAVEEFLRNNPNWVLKERYTNNNGLTILERVVFHENWYSEKQCYDLVSLVNNVNKLSGNIIEIGCWEGKSAIHIANNCYPNILICNDTWLGNIQESIITGQTHITELICKERDVYGTFITNMNTLTKQNYMVVKKDCIEWLNEYNEPIKFIHIDASHEYESVFETIKLALPKMVNGGIICGDDFLSANINRTDLHGGVERAVRELLPTFKNIENLWYYTNN